MSSIVHLLKKTFPNQPNLKQKRTKLMHLGFKMKKKLQQLSKPQKKKNKRKEKINLLPSQTMKKLLNNNQKKIMLKTKTKKMYLESPLMTKLLRHKKLNERHLKRLKRRKLTTITFLLYQTEILQKYLKKQRRMKMRHKMLTMPLIKINHQKYQKQLNKPKIQKKSILILQKMKKIMVKMSTKHQKRKKQKMFLLLMKVMKKLARMKQNSLPKKRKKKMLLEWNLRNQKYQILVKRLKKTKKNFWNKKKKKKPKEMLLKNHLKSTLNPNKKKQNRMTFHYNQNLKFLKHVSKLKTTKKNCWRMKREKKKKAKSLMNLKIKMN
ncbi:hypothetical protein TRFO_01829 [Tritrichomonas foetus]|uniref:Uncharacterized protein n=1 Tax=Tritrichomonas foetus TaxID=1144522 RepID=A0A1J4JJJ7_9EUKA|nr:hypothetical protein TRFO_01829 [Tritrichomonas foetus]|eukprot:OHS98785.1 hypothetical protein TRFO_01829 [Tritrichomonas foetus]